MNNCIFLTFDDSYFEYAKVCINSLKNNYPDHPLVLIYYTGSNMEVIDFIRNKEDMQLITLDYNTGMFSNLNLGVIGSPMIYNRFLLWEDYFLKYDTIIYLDCDTVILKPFAELFEKTDFFAVSDNSGGIVFEEYYHDKQLKALAKDDGIDLNQIDDFMINSGVLVIPKLYRDKTNKENLWRFVKKYDKFTHHSDQSILTLWMYSQNLIPSHDYKYNYQIHFVMRPKIENVKIESIKILHYAYFKPNKKINHLKKKIEFADEIVSLAKTKFNQFS